MKKLAEEKAKDCLNYLKFVENVTTRKTKRQVS